LLVTLLASEKNSLSGNEVSSFPMTLKAFSLAFFNTENKLFASLEYYRKYNGSGNAWFNWL